MLITRYKKWYVYFRLSNLMKYGYWIWRVAANKLNKQSRTNHKGWSSGLGVGRDAKNPSP